MPTYSINVKRREMMFYVAICDDDEYFRKRERDFIEKYMNGKGYKYRIDIFGSGKDILNLKQSISQYDIVFLDINMKDINGIETAKEIRRITKDIYIVFVTAFITYAPEGYKVDAIRYLLKEDEFLERAIIECLETIVYKMNYEEHKHVFDFQEGKIELFYDDILYIESNLHKLIFHIKEKDYVKYTMYAKLDDVDKLLKGSCFCRIHKSYLVNLKYVETVERYKARLSGGTSLGISKSHYLDTRNEWICYKGEI